MKVWITKYALSGGIREVDAEPSAVVPGLICVRKHGSWLYCHSKDWRASYAEAIADAERRRAAKIASLKKQIAKLEKLKFTE